MGPFAIVCSLLSASLVVAEAFEPSPFDAAKALDEILQSSGTNATCSSCPKGQDPCSFACSSLARIYSNDKDAVETSGLDYDVFLQSYWSKVQSDLAPKCIFKPASPRDVSVAILLSRLTQCPFAIKSGGHAAFHGASNIQGGITVSLERLNSIDLAPDGRTVAVGAGNTWYQVYAALQPRDLAVVGGRAAGIGVGGLTTGGGISFFSSMYGLVCDNVASYDVITASGVPLTASPTSHPDLYWALRGGGNNLAIVVTFHLRTIPLPNRGSMWAGRRIYADTPLSPFSSLASAFSTMVAASPSDPKAGQYLAWGISNGTRLAVAGLYRAEAPTLTAPHAPIFSDYFALPAILDTTGPRLLPALTQEYQADNPPGSRQLFYTLTVRASPQLAQSAQQIYYAALAPLLSSIPGVLPALVYQSLTQPILDYTPQNGGNALGLDPADGPLYVILFSCTWSRKEDDDMVHRVASDVLSAIKKESDRLGKESRFVYMNYASKYQDVLRGYGTGNLERLRGVAGRYDPAGVFQKLQPGYFKLNGAPETAPGMFSW